MIKHFDLLLFYVDDFIKHCFILDTTFRSKYFGPNPCVVIALENMPVKLKYYLSWKSDLGTDIFICHTTRAAGTEEVPATIVVLIKNAGILYYSQDNE